MGNGKGSRGFRALVVALVVAAPASAYAHARMLSPKPRNNDDGIKTGPCGNVPRTQSFTQLAPGATVKVDWEETIDHGGCFDIVFSAQGDKDWVRLARIPDDAGTPNTKYSGNVKLPDGVSCEACTIALRQIMVPGNAPCQPATADALDGGPSTYYSCADIRVGDFPDAAPSADPQQPGGEGTDEPGADEDEVSAGGDAGTDGTPRRPQLNLRSGAGESCSVGWGATSGLSLVVSAGLGAMAFLRRRRRG